MPDLPGPLTRCPEWYGEGMLPMNYTLIPGQSHVASEEETMSMIRSVLTEDGPETAEGVTHTETEAPEGEAPVKAFVERTAQPAPRRRANDLPDLGVAEMSEPAAPSRKMTAGLFTPVMRAVARLRAFQPTTRHLALVSMALLVILRPHWFVLGLVLGLMLTVAFVMILGTDRIWRGVLTWLTRVEAHDPARAADLRARLDRFACRWDAVLDIFPDGMVDGLYMPDLQAMQHAEAAHAAVVADRLNRMVHDA